MANENNNLNRESVQRIQDAAKAIKEKRMLEAQKIADQNAKMSEPIPSPPSERHSELSNDSASQTGISDEDQVVFYNHQNTDQTDRAYQSAASPVPQQNEVIPGSIPKINTSSDKTEDGFVDISPAAAGKKIKSDENISGTYSYTNHVQTNNANKRKKPMKRIILSVISCIAAVLMLVSGTGCVIMYSYLSSVNYQAIDTDMDTVKKNNNENSSANQNSVQTTNTYEGKLMNDKQILNILLIGADTRKGQDKGNSDTMILLSVDTKNKKLKLLSFMRDTWVAIPGYEDNKLNASFTYGGAELTVKTVQANYGIQIDRYAIVDFKSFRKIIDKLGGIDIELTQEEVDYIDWQCWVNNQVDTRNELNAYSYTYTPNKDGTEVAMVHLNGRQALWHARNRGEDGICSGDDYVRTLRQRNVISIMINKIKKSDSATLLNTLSEIGSMITTNLKSSEIISLAQNITKYLKYDIVSQSAPDSSTINIDYYYSDYYEHPTYVYGDFVDSIVIADWQDFRSKIANFVFQNENKLKKDEEQPTE